MKMLPLLLSACALAGCSSGRQQAAWTPPQFDPPRAGQIEVALIGDVKQSGTHWIVEPATLASVEALAGDGTRDPAPRKVMITRINNGHPNNTVLVLAKMSQIDKQVVLLRHGDVVQFYAQEPAVFPR